MKPIKVWPASEVFKVPGEEKYSLSPQGVYSLATTLTQLEWILSGTDEIARIKPYIEPFRHLTEILAFEDIGDEAIVWHDRLSNTSLLNMTDGDRNTLRQLKTRWETMISSKLSDCWLITPVTSLQPKRLMGGIAGLISEEDAAALIELEVFDLNEACLCLLVGSPTAGEHISLRAAESLLRRWYQQKTGEIIERQTWGVVLDRLTQEYPADFNRPKEISLLGYLKTRRDETAHPDRVSTLTEAERTLMNVCSLLTGVRPFLPEPASQSGPSSNES